MGTTQTISPFGLEIDNISYQEFNRVLPYLSRDLTQRSEQIKFINGHTPINDTIVNSNIDPELIAKQVKDLRKINSLQATTAKFTVVAVKEIDDAVDTLGTTILGGLDKLTNWAEEGINSMERGLKYVENQAAGAKKKLYDRTIAPCSKWADKKLQGVSQGLVEDLSKFNAKLKNNRMLNMSGDAFNSGRHILYALRGELEKLTDFAHQIFAGISAAIIKLRRLMQKAIKAITTFLIGLIEILIPTEFLMSIVNSISPVLMELGTSLQTFVDTIGLGDIGNIFDGITNEFYQFADQPLKYLFDSVGMEVFSNVPAINNLTKFSNSVLNSLNDVTKTIDGFTIDALLQKVLSNEALKTINIINEISHNAHGFIGNGVRSFVKNKILKGKSSATLGNVEGKFGVRFSLAQSFHYNTPSVTSLPPLITFKKLMTDKPDVVVDSRGNKLNYLSFTSTHLF